MPWGAGILGTVGAVADEGGIGGPVYGEFHTLAEAGAVHCVGRCELMFAFKCEQSFTLTFPSSKMSKEKGT